jgi:hypothetical protein
MLSKSLGKNYIINCCIKIIIYLLSLLTIVFNVVDVDDNYDDDDGILIDYNKKFQLCWLFNVGYE